MPYKIRRITPGNQEKVLEEQINSECAGGYRLLPFLIGEHMVFEPLATQNLPLPDIQKVSAAIDSIVEGDKRISDKAVKKTTAKKPNAKKVVK